MVPTTMEGRRGCLATTEGWGARTEDHRTNLEPGAQAHPECIPVHQVGMYILHVHMFGDTSFGNPKHPSVRWPTIHLRLCFSRVARPPIMTERQPATAARAKVAVQGWMLSSCTGPWGFTHYLLILRRLTLRVCILVC
jgi:hypothetical protein